MRQILVVNDCISTLAQVVGILERNGYSTIHTDEALEAPMMILTEEPSALIVDLEMESMGGSELIRLVRSWPAFAAMPILALAPVGAVGAMDAALAAGANDCLAKPIREELLVNHVTSRFWPETKRVVGPTASELIPRMATAGLGRRRGPSASGSAKAVVAAKGLASAVGSMTALARMGQRKV